MSKLFEELLGVSEPQTNNTLESDTNTQNEETIDTTEKRKRGRPRKFVKQSAKEETEEPLFKLPNIAFTDYTRLPITLESMMPNVIDGVGIQYMNRDGVKEPVLILPMDFGKLRLQLWKLDRGGLLLQDLKRHISNPEAPERQYYMFSHEESKICFVAAFVEQEYILSNSVLKQYVIETDDAPDGYELVFFMYTDPDVKNKHTLTSKSSQEPYVYNMLDQSEDVDDSNTAQWSNELDEDDDDEEIFEDFDDSSDWED